MLTTILERYVLIELSVNAVRDHYISTTFLSCALFVMATTVLYSRKPGWLGRGMAFVGRYASVWIYIFHPIVLSAFSFISKVTKTHVVYQFVAPFAAYIFCVLCVVFTRKVIIKKQ